MRRNLRNDTSGWTRGCEAVASFMRRCEAMAMRGIACLKDEYGESVVDIKNPSPMFGAEYADVKNGNI